MKLERTWLGRTFEPPVPWGTHDRTTLYKDYAISTNTSLDYAYVRKFDKEEWTSWFQDKKSECLQREYAKGYSKQKAVSLAQDRLQDEIDSAYSDEFWPDHESFGGGSYVWNADDMLELVPKRYRNLYQNSYGVDVIQIIQDYPKKVITWALENCLLN